MKDSHIALHWPQLCMDIGRHTEKITLSANSSFRVSYFSGLSQAFTLRRQRISFGRKLWKRNGKSMADYATCNAFLSAQAQYCYPK